MIFRTTLTNLQNERPNLVICGDYNICHEAIDIHDPIRNKRVSGFLPEERQWLDGFMKAVLSTVSGISIKNRTIIHGGVISVMREATIKAGASIMRLCRSR